MANDLTDITNNYKKQLEKGYAAADYSKQYESIGNNLSAARNAQFEAQKQQLNAQKDQLAKDYRSQRSDAFVNAKKNAQLNNESLAAHGLARDMYGLSASGASELSRTKQNAALLKNINSLNVEQQQQTSAIDKSIADAGYERDLAVAQDLADLKQQQLAAQQQEDQFARGYNLDAYNALVSQQASSAANDLALQELTEQQKQNAIENTLARDELAEQQRQNKFSNQLAQNAFAEQQRQNAVSNQLAQDEFTELQKQNAFKNSLSQNTFTEQQKQNAMQNALTEIALYGEVKTDAAAAALGIKKGTQLTDDQLRALGVSIPN